MYSSAQLESAVLKWSKKKISIAKLNRKDWREILFLTSTTRILNQGKKLKHLKQFPQIFDRVTHLLLMPEPSILLQKLVIDFGW